MNTMLGTQGGILKFQELGIYLLDEKGGNPVIKGSREGMWSLRTQVSWGPFHLHVDQSRLKAWQERKTQQGDKKRKKQWKQKVSEQRTESPEA